MITEMIGRKFGRLTVSGIDTNGLKGHRRVVCHCECGAMKTVRLSRLLEGRVNSCGCLKHVGHPKHGHAKQGKNTPEYRAWCGMIRRCEQQNLSYYGNYGGRGIRVCEAWRKDFSLFLHDVGPRPSPQYTIDRINNDGNYEPGNVRWALWSVQQNNRRSNHQITFDGMTKTLSNWASSLGIEPSTIRQRLRRGWSIENALFTPVTQNRRRAI